MAETVSVDDETLSKLGFNLSLGDIERQSYEKTILPEGVVKIKTAVFSDGQGGHFLEDNRINELHLIESLLEKGIKLEVRQTNTSVAAPETIRMGHVHPHQNELWMVVFGQMTVGLCDLRAGSSTKEVKSKLILTAGDGLYIPHGVAHGLANFTQKEIVLNYFADHQFNTENSEEFRFLPRRDSFWDFIKPDTN